MGKDLGTGTVITAQKAYHLEDGDRITAPVVSSAGVLGVHSGGTAMNIVESGGLVIVETGGTATFTPATFSDLTLSSANLGGNIVAVHTATVHSGTTANRTTLLTGYDLEVYSGGTANSTTVNYGCLLRVLSDGTANDTDLGIIGSLYVSNGGVANRTSGGIVHVFISGTVNSTTVDRYMLVHASATANSTTILDGEVIVDGKVNDTTISGGSMEIFSGAAASRTAIRNGGLFNVSSGGTASIATVLTGGSMQVFSAGLAKSAHLSGGSMTVSFGGTASSAVVSAGKMYVDGIAVSATVSGGSMEVFSATGAASGGTATATTVRNGGFFFVSPNAVASNTKIAETGSMTVSEGATADNTSMTGAGAYLTIEKGGVANSTTVSKGNMFVSGTANSGTVTVEGGMYVAAGGQANDVNVSKGGALHVRAFGTAAAATVTSAELHVSSNGVATGATVKKAGLLHVSNGGSADNATVSKGGSIIVSNGGLATNTLIKLGGIAIISGNAEKTTVNQMGADEDATLTVFDGGKTTSTTINSKGYMHISNGGQATSTTVNYGGLLYVSNGGQATSTFVEDYGSMYVLEGGKASGARVSKGGCMHVSNGGSASSTYLYGGVMHASEGATVSGVMATQGAILHVSAGANVTEIVERGGYVDLADGVTATFLSNTFKELTLSNESATVHSMTKAVDITLANFGSLTVYSGGTATGTILNGGRLRISSGGVASNTTVTNGDFMVSSGGKVTGVTTIAETRSCQVIEGGIFDFDISAISPANEALVNDLSLVTGTPTYTLTVSGVQAEGTYILAGGSVDFGKTITVLNKSGTELGTLGIGSDLTAGGVKYTLAQAAGNKLTVTVEGMVFTGNLENQKKEITSGMSAVNVNVKTGGYLYVFSGGVARDTNVSGTETGIGYMDVEGVASNTTVKTSGFFVVSSGGTAVGTVNDGGYFYVSAGGVASNTTVKPSPVTMIQGTVEGVAVDGGVVNVEDGGIVRNATIDSNGKINISAGGKLTGTFNILNGWVSACEGGIVDFDISALSPGNTVFVDKLWDVVDGTPTFTLTVSDTQAGGTYNLTDETGYLFDATKTITVFNTAGTELGTLTVGSTTLIGETNYTLNWNDYALAVTVAGGAGNIITGDITGETKDVTAGMSAVNVNINENGKLNILNGGVADNTTVNTNGELNVSSGGVANDTTVDEGTVNIAGGGTANNITLDNMGYLYISSGGVANDVTLASGNARLTVHPGGTATGVVWTPGVGRIVGGGLVTFANSYSGVYYASNGTLIESADTLDGRTFDSFNCEVYVTDGGKTTNTTLDAGFVYVWSGGVASSTTLNGGHLNVSSGGTAGDVNLLEGYAFISSGGVVSNAAVHADAKQFEVYFGGKATGIMDFEAGAYISIQPGGVLDFDISALAPETVLLVNDLSIVQGTPDFTLTVSDLQADGKYSLAGGATGFDKTITVFNTSGTELGTISIADGTKDIGGVKYTLALDGSELTVTVSDGVKVDLTGDLNSTFELQNGMVASNVNVNSGGSLVVLPGATATKIRENGGLVAIVDTAEVLFAPNSFGGMALNGTEATVHAGTTATEVTVGPNGAIHVSSGGTALLIKENGGFVRVLEGAKVTYAPNTFSDVVVGRSATIHSGTVAKNTTVDSGGTATIYEGGIANSVALENWGNLQVFSGGTASDITVASGYVFVSSGAVASNAAIIDPDGIFLIYPGGKFTGIMTLAEDACANATDGGTFDFDISALGPENAAFVNDISRIHGTPFYTLTVSDTQADGKYSLAGGATGFDKTITVVNTLGAALDTISIADGTKDIGGVKYTLALDGSDLTVTVAGKAASDATPPTVTNITASTTKLTNHNVFVTAVFDDDKGLKSQQYRIDDGAWTDYVDGVVVTENATVYFKAIDTSDNESAEASYTVSNIDKVAPTITNITHSPTTPAKSVTVTADFNDDVDLATKQYRIGTSGAWTDYEDGVIMNENGTVYFWAVDAAGNESPTVSHTVDNIDDSVPDTTPPVITITPSTTEPTTSMTVSAVFSDDAAVATKQYRVGDGDWKDYSDPIPVTENVTVGFRATDTSGNSTTESYLVTNIENEPKNDKLYDKKTKKWADPEDIGTFSMNEVKAGDSMVYLDKKGSVESEDGKYFNSVGRFKTEAGTVEDTADYGKIVLEHGAALRFSVDSTIGGTLYVYGTTWKKDDLVPVQRQKISVKAGKVSPAKLSTIYLEAGEYFVGMEAKLPAAKKNPEVSAYYNVQLTGTKYFEDADDGWNDHAYALDANGKEDKTKLNAALVSGAYDFGRGATAIEPDTGKNWVGFSDATDYKMLKLENAVNLTLNFTATGKAKLAIWEVSTGKGGKITLSSKGSVTVKADKTGTIKAKFLDAGEYFVSVTSTDAKKGGDAYYSIAVDNGKTVFFDSADGHKNDVLYDKKAKAFCKEDANHHFETTTVGANTKVKLDSDPVADTDWENFVGYEDAVDYAKIKLTGKGKLSFHVEATGDATFTFYRKGEKKGVETLETVQTAKLAVAKGKTTAVKTMDVLSELEAGEYYVSMAAKNTKATDKGSVFYNVTAFFSTSTGSALAMPETDALAGASVDSYLDSASDKLLGETGNGLLA